MNELRTHVVSMINYKTYLRMLYVGAIELGKKDTAILLKDIVEVYEEQISDLNDIINREEVAQLN